jgi:hypothetical protein
MSDEYPRTRMQGNSGETGGIIAQLEQGKLVVSSDSDSDPAEECPSAKITVFSQRNTDDKATRTHNVITEVVL